MLHRPLPNGSDGRHRCDKNRYKKNTDTRTWESVSADYPEECPVGKENEENEANPEDEIPAIEVKPDDPEKTE